MNSKDWRFIEFALNVAEKAPEQKFKVGSVVVRKGIPISFGINNMAKTHPLAAKNRFPYIHSELHALIGVDSRKLCGATIYVARRKRTGEIGLAKPCSECEKLLRQYNIKRVCYSRNNNEIGEMML